MIEIKNCTINYGHKKAVNGLSLNLEKGMVHGFVGLNGSGKTSLLNALSGLIKFEGTILYKNQKITKREIGFLETNNFFFSNITGKEYLGLFKCEISDPFLQEEWSEIFQLPLNDLIESYSVGMRKKLALLGVIKLGRDIFVMDEPYNGLDLESGKILELTIKKLKEKGRTILITSHILETLTTSCDFIHHLLSGELKGTYQREEFPKLKELIFGDFEIRISKSLSLILDK